MAEWLKGCEICNAALVTEMKKRVGKGESERAAAEALSKEATIDGVTLYSPETIRRRFQYHTGKAPAQNVPPPADAKAQASSRPKQPAKLNKGNKVIEIPTVKRGCPSEKIIENGLLALEKICDELEKHEWKTYPREYLEKKLWGLLRQVSPARSQVNKYYNTMKFSEAAISNLEQIKKDDPERANAFNNVISWCENQLKENLTYH